MTSIVVWPSFEIQHAPSMWAVGDTLVSNKGGRLIGDAAKIFGLPVICRAPGSKGFFSEVYFSHSFGYCFAGSTLMGHNTYLSVAPLLSELISSSHYVPSMNDVAQFMLLHADRTYDQYKAIAADQAHFEICVFGWCHREQSLEAWHFKPELIDGEYKMTSARHKPLQFGDFIYLGSHKDHASALLREAFSNPSQPGLPAQRSPLQVVKNLIEDNVYHEIGGDRQLAIANKYGFQPYTLFRPVVQGKAQAYNSFLGIEFTEENSIVGEACVGGPGLAVD